MRRALAIACLCSCGPAAPPAAPGASPPLTVRMSEKRSVPCAANNVERHPTTLADLDGNGTLDRIAVVREANELAVTLYESPSFAARGTWTLQPATGYVEVASPRRRGSTRGDAWISVGTERGGTWQSTLYQLAGGRLAPVATTSASPVMRIDVDGDGRVDPILSDPVRARLADGRELRLPVDSVSDVHGAPAGFGQEEAVDLDGNGVRELVFRLARGVAIYEVPSLREVWSARGQAIQPELVRWGNAHVLAVRLDDIVRIYATDASHARIAEYPGPKSYGSVEATIGDLMVMSVYPRQLYARAAPTVVAAEVHGLVHRLDDPLAPVGPLRLGLGDVPGMLAYRRDGGRTELVLLDPATRAAGRVVWSTDFGDGIASDLSAAAVDLDRDGASELFVTYHESEFMHHGSSWTSSQFELLDGHGRSLWKEVGGRTSEWAHDDEGKRPMRAIRVDDTRARAFDLGDGTMPLRVRSGRDEYYLLTSRSKLGSIPPCLE